MSLWSGHLSCKKQDRKFQWQDKLKTSTDAHKQPYHFQQDRLTSTTLTLGWPYSSSHPSILHSCQSFYSVIPISKLWTEKARGLRIRAGWLKQSKDQTQCIQQVDFWITSTLQAVIAIIACKGAEPAELWITHDHLSSANAANHKIRRPMTSLLLDRQNSATFTLRHEPYCSSNAGLHSC